MNNNFFYSAFCFIFVYQNKTTTMDINKKYEENMDAFKNIRNSMDNGNIDEAIDSLEAFSYSLSWERMYNDGWIKEPEDMISPLNYFIRIKDTKKSEYIAWMLNKYYPNYLKNIFELALENEEYEKCESLKDLIKIKDMPII